MPLARRAIPAKSTRDTRADPPPASSRRGRAPGEWTRGGSPPGQSPPTTEMARYSSIAITTETVWSDQSSVSRRAPPRSGSAAKSQSSEAWNSSARYPFTRRQRIARSSRVRRESPARRRRRRCSGRSTETMTPILTRLPISRCLTSALPSARANSVLTTVSD